MHVVMGIQDQQIKPSVKFQVQGDALSQKLQWRVVEEDTQCRLLTSA